MMACAFERVNYLKYIPWLSSS